MTWVIAHVNPIAVVMLSDIRISIDVDGRTQEITEFGVKKIYHVAPTVFAGFAGSIPLGFSLIDDLDVHLQDAYHPHVPTSSLARDWVRSLSPRLARMEHPARARPTSMIVAGMHLAPTDEGERRPMGTGSVIVLPRGLDGDADVEPFSWSRGGVSIGSGGDVPQYKEMLSELPWIEFSQWGDNAEGVISWIVQNTIQTTPSLGVSPDLHVMIMLHGPSGIVGRGRSLGAMASDRALIAEDEDQLHVLWQRYSTAGAPEAAVGGTRSSASVASHYLARS
jgi:hypothetical protein